MPTPFEPPFGSGSSSSQPGSNSQFSPFAFRSEGETSEAAVAPSLPASEPSGFALKLPGRSMLGPMAIIAGLIAVAAVIFWLSSSGSGGLSSFNNLFSGDTDSVAFVAQSDMDRSQAKELYRQAVANLQSGEYEKALTQFKKLEPVYPGLKDMLWLHQADCYAAQGNEWAVQKKLNSIISDLPNSPLKALAQYRLGQSRFRGSEWDKALETFTQIRKDTPDSTYAAGSLYYLAALKARDPKQKVDVITLLREYLRDYADGKFGGEAAELLEKIQAAPTPEDHALIGLAYASASSTADSGKAVAHLKKGATHITWHAMGRLLIKADKKDEGISVIGAGLRYAKDMDEFIQALDTALAAASTPERKKAILNSVRNEKPPLGGDYVLWKLAELDEASALKYYRDIVTAYPRGDYAPESQWRLLWPLLTQNRASDYISQAQQFMSEYPYARSAPKVLFWIGKAQEKSDTNLAAQTYSQIRDNYPGTYYAFRAISRLKVLTEGGSDPGWAINKPTEANYPSANTSLNELPIIPSAETFGAGRRGGKLREAAVELQRIGVPEDTRLYVTEALGYLPASVESWAAQTGGERSRGIRVMRNALEKRSRQSIQGLSRQEINASNTRLNALMESVAGQKGGTNAELKLLYPVYFSDLIRTAAVKTGLDPYLIQSLMREESYFNEFAVSSSNARGLMQLLPTTAAEVAHWETMPEFRSEDLFNPKVNIRLGSRYLSHLLQLFQGNAMPSVGAYNGGPNAMKRWVIAPGSAFSTDPDFFVERIPYGQSRDYIKKVFGGYWNYRQLYGK